MCGLSSYTHPCQGKCRFYFHRECIGIFDEQQTLICTDCSSSRIGFERQSFFHVNDTILDRLLCTICQELITDNECQCSFNQCNRIYHLSCLTNCNLTTSTPTGGFYCPLHVCATCHLHKRPNDSIGIFLARSFIIGGIFLSRSSVYLFVLSNGLSWS